MSTTTVGSVMADILPYLGVATNYTQEDIAGRRIVVEDLSGLTLKQAQAILKEQSLTAQTVGEGDTVIAQIPRPGQTVPGGSQVLLYFDDGPQKRTVEVPDFTGMNRQQADAAAGELGLYILVSGNQSLSPNVIVTSQSHPAGSKVDAGTMIQLEFTDTKVSD